MADDDPQHRFAEISTAFPTVPESVGAARRFVAVSLRRFDFSPDAIGRAVLVTSELVAVAFAAGRPPIRLRVRSLGAGRAMVEVNHTLDAERVDDGDPGALRLHLTPAGRSLVDSTAERWGIRPADGSVTAWFEIDDRDLATTGPGVAASDRT